MKAKEAIAKARSYQVQVVTPPSWQEKAKEMRAHFGKDLLTQGEIAEYMGFARSSGNFNRFIACVPALGQGKGKRYPVDCVAKAYMARLN